MSKNIRTEAVDHLFEAILCLKDKEPLTNFFLYLRDLKWPRC